MVDEIKDETNKQAREERRSADTEQLQKQIAQLQEDLKAIGSVITKLSGDTLSDIRARAEEEYRHARARGGSSFDDISDQASDIEKSLKHTIRERPFTAVAGALGIGYLLALLSRH